VAHAISFARAIQSGIWRKEQETGREPRVEYSQAAIEGAERLIEGQDAAWEQMFRDLKIEPLRLWYEDALAAPAEAVRQVADYLGVELSPDAVVAVPEVRKQSQADAEDWAAQYKRSKV
jgi:LPS sulfotransferase NodH